MAHSSVNASNLCLSPSPLQGIAAHSSLTTGSKDLASAALAFRQANSPGDWSIFCVRFVNLLVTPISLYFASMSHHRDSNLLAALPLYGPSCKISTRTDPRK
eukprot:15360503-Alexandrium_andersonii.AAC.1